MVSKSVIEFILLISNSELIDFLTASDSPVKDDWLTYRSFASIILKSAGIIEPLDNKTTSPIVILWIGILIFFPSRITDEVVPTSSLSFSAALLDRNSSKNSKKVLAVTKIKITIILA